MSFRIRPKQDFTSEFRRTAREQLEAAITDLEHQDDGLHAAIHAMRKRLKRLRSLYRLVAKEVPDFAKQENARLRDVGRSLSAVRDAAAMIEVVHRLQHESERDEERLALGRIADLLAKRRDHIAEHEFDAGHLPEAIETLRAGLAALDGVSFERSLRRNARMLAKSWRRTGRKAKLAIKACREQATDDDFHDLRKRSYDYRLNHLLLRDVWPSAMVAKHDAAKALIERLGHINDLAVLSALVDEEPQLFTVNNDLSHLLDAIISSRQRNREAALSDADRLFSDKPADEAACVQLLWLDAGSR